MKKQHPGVARYRAQQDEWTAISEELKAARAGRPVTAHEVTTEQRQRMLARGERRMTLQEIIDAYDKESVDA